MSEPVLAHAMPERSGPEIRLMIRLSMTYVLDTLAVARGGRSVLDLVLLGAIGQANHAEVARSLELQRAYADQQDPAPDALRRPISVNALAASMRQPFETVRRRVKRLVAAGVCEEVEGGVIIPARYMSSPEYVAQSLAAYQRLRLLYEQLRDTDLLAPLPRHAAALSGGAFPVRAVVRLVTDYLLRTIECLVREPQGLLDSLITLEIFRGNVEHMAAVRRGGPELIAEHMAPDEDRAPVSVSAVANRIGLPHETVRRRVHGLVERGRCRKVDGGFIVPAEILASGTFGELMVANVGNLQRLFSGLATLGILAMWDAQS